ncbi:MAG: hypothetical protein ACRDJH_09460 [Thermomicrobiales bacterium]
MASRLTTVLAVFLAFLMVISVGGVTAQDARPVAKGDRALSITVTVPEDGEYEPAFAIAQDAGMDEIELTFRWDELETAPGEYVGDGLAAVNQFYPARGMPVSLMVAPLSSVEKSVPADLAGVAFDDPAFIERYQRLLDFVFGALPDVEIPTLVIGLEVESHLLANAEGWAQYERFYAAVADYARTLRPGLRVGVEGLQINILGPAAGYFDVLNAHSDFVAVSYFPLDEAGMGRPLDGIAAEFDALTAHYPDQTIRFTQLCYPSSAVNDSSVQMQAQFVREVFAAWDDHAEQIERIEFTWLHDLSPEGVEAFSALFQHQNEQFAAFLGTVGLRTYPSAGQDKPALDALREEAAARGW